VLNPQDAVGKIAHCACIMPDQGTELMQGQRKSSDNYLLVQRPVHLQIGKAANGKEFEGPAYHD